MNKTNDTSTLDHGTFEDHEMLEDTELNAVTGGTPIIPTSVELGELS